MLDQTAILSTLARHREELRALGAQRLSLFGSYARNAATDASDVDVLVDLKPKTLDSYMQLKFRLEELLGRPVDLVLRDGLKSGVADSVLSETIDDPGS
jgi:predicted nucleotidyltransferase